MNRSVPMRPVAGSTAITHEYYDKVNRVLHLQFTGAKEPSIIEDVAEATYREFLAAPSKGRFFHERLRT